MKQILVTDTLFIFDEHVEQFEAAGYEVVRIEKPDMPEDELIEAVKGKTGYILGGIEHVTDKVIDAADELKAISLTGIGYEWFIPGWKHALEKGILISNTPSGPTQEVAEWALTACLVMNRQFLELGLVGDKKFAVTKGIEGQKVGIIGLGRVGNRVAELLQPFRPASIAYYSRSQHAEDEQKQGVVYRELPDLLKESDILFVTVSDEAKSLLSTEELAHIKKDALLVNITHPGIIDEEALWQQLNEGRFRAISDYPMLPKFNDLPLGRWYSMKSTNTFTEAGSRLMSDMATTSLLNLLEKGDDEYRIDAE